MFMMYFAAGVAFAVILGIIIYIKISFAKKAEDIAFSKGYGDEVHAFKICFLCGIFGWLYILGLPNLVESRKTYEMLEEIRKQKE